MVCQYEGFSQVTFIDTLIIDTLIIDTDTLTYTDFIDHFFLIVYHFNTLKR